MAVGRPGLCVFGIPYTCGFVWAGTARANPRPLDLRGLIRLAAEHSLGHVEVPLRLLGDDPDRWRAARAAAEEAGIGLIVAGGRVEAESLRRHLAAAVAVGSPVVRCTLSGVLCGDRRGLAGGWRAVLERAQEELAAILPDAERHGVAIAIENHQDATSDDLVALCERLASPAVGVTLDTGNPLAVMEEPLAFADRVAPFLRHVHLKDYTVHHAPNGFRLVRCALGAGAIPFSALFARFRALPRRVTCSIELGAYAARRVPFCEPDWWAEYPGDHRRHAIAAIGAIWPHLRPATEEWRTPVEKDASGDALLRHEQEALAASVAYLRAIGALVE